MTERIAALGLTPHIEGGYFAELHRSALLVHPADGRGERAALTVIHYLLARGQCSRWHVVSSDEQWTWLEGEALELHLWPRGGPHQSIVLGPGRPTAVVPAATWQAARALGAYALVCCTVGPGFEFTDYAQLADDAAGAHELREALPELAHLL